MNPEHLLGTARSVPAREDLNSDLVRLEEAYRSRNYVQRSEIPDQVLIVGPRQAPQITLLAQHAINHFDACGQAKLADRGTGGLVELLASRLDIRGIISTGRLRDPERQQQRNSMMATIAIDIGRPCVDLHGMSCEGDSAIDIGLGRDPSYESRLIADAAVASGEQLGLRITRNQRFPAIGPERLTNTLLDHGVPAIQVEICACLRQPCGGAAETTLVVAWFNGLAAAIKQVLPH